MDAVKREPSLDLDKKYKRCYFFWKSGHCKFGSDCKFSHQTVAGNSLQKARRHSQRSRKFANGFSSNKDEAVSHCMPVTNEKLLLSEINVPNEYSRDEKLNAESTDQPDVDSTLLSSEVSKGNVRLHPSIDRTAKKKSPLCYYFKKGYCYRGNRCKFYHQNSLKEQCLLSNDSEPEKELNSVEEINDSKTHSNLEESKQISEISKNNPSFHKPLLHLGSVSSLRSTEIAQLKKRFPHLEEAPDNGTFVFMFEPSDPDWPFDVKKIKIQVHFPEAYPEERCVVSILKHAEYIPDLLIKFLNKSISDWISIKYEDRGGSKNMELIFRPFLKWLDKNLEELFICGLRKVKQDIKAKEDGIEFVPVEDLFPSSTEACSSGSSNQEETHETDNTLNRNTDSVSSLASLLTQTSISTSKPAPTAKEISNKQYHSFGNNVMKAFFTELELIEGAAALVCSKVSLTLQCCRCRSSFHSKSTPKKNNVFACSKCSKNVGFTLESCTMHPFSNVLGNLYLLDCVAVDLNLVECQFLVDCLNCSKQVPIDSIHYGQKHKLWCTYCHGKMIITIGSIKFQTIKRSSLSDSNSAPTKKNEKKIKDPVIKGESLPYFGACKHYKKSFRWLRFPCCGRLYPCDECHNEKETDHEMKYASRMVCGFCAKEQLYTKDRPCQSCSQSMTKKSGCHWEGGKGCRNKIQMCREDRQKYAGTCKTVSKKAQSLKKEK